MTSRALLFRMVVAALVLKEGKSQFREPKRTALGCIAGEDRGWIRTVVAGL